MKEEFDALFAEHQKLLGELQAMKSLAQPEQEPEWYHGVDAYGCDRFYHKTEARTSEFNTPLYNTPPQRNPLTDEQIWGIKE